MKKFEEFLKGEKKKSLTEAEVNALQREMRKLYPGSSIEMLGNSFYITTWDLDAIDYGINIGTLLEFTSQEGIENFLVELEQLITKFNPFVGGSAVKSHSHRPYRSIKEKKRKYTKHVTPVSLADLRKTFHALTGKTIEEALHDQRGGIASDDIGIS